MVPLLIIWAYLAFIALIVFLCKKAKINWFWIVPIVVVFLFAPFWDTVLAKGIMWKFKRQNKPLQQISSTVESPESVLWIDNVWPGYDANGRHWMVSNYLDGVHLNTLVLNGDDGKYYLYHATLNDFSGSEAIRPKHEKMNNMITKLEEEAKAAARKPGGNRELWQIIRNEHKPRLKILGYEKTRKQEVERVFDRGKVYQSMQELPPIRYQVSFNRIPLTKWQEQYVWCDGINITDVSLNKELADSKRCLQYTPMATIIYRGGSPFEGGTHIGNKQAYNFDDEVLFGYAKERRRGSEFHSNTFYRNKKFRNQ